MFTDSQSPVQTSVRKTLISYLGLVRISCSSIPSMYFRIILSKFGTRPAGVSIKWNKPTQKLPDEGDRELIIGSRFDFTRFRKKWCKRDNPALKTFLNRIWIETTNRSTLWNNWNHQSTNNWIRIIYQRWHARVCFVKMLPRKFLLVRFPVPAR